MKPTKRAFRAPGECAPARSWLLSRSARSPSPAPPADRRGAGLDDSLRLIPPADLALEPAAQRKADALANFVEGARLEESGEVEAALEAYQKVLTVDPGEIELASRVASLLTRQEDFPRAIDILKDAIKANPKETAPFLQLAFLYAKYLRKPDQALKYANQAIALDPENIDAYQRIYEIEVTRGRPKEALATLDRAAKVNSTNAGFWTRLGKLYAASLFQPDTDPRAGRSEAGQRALQARGRECRRRRQRAQGSGRLLRRHRSKSTKPFRFI